MSSIFFSIRIRVRNAYPFLPPDFLGRTLYHDPNCIVLPKICRCLSGCSISLESFSMAFMLAKAKRVWMAFSASLTRLVPNCESASTNSQTLQLPPPCSSSSYSRSIRISMLCSEPKGYIPFRNFHKLLIA